MGKHKIVVGLGFGDEGKGTIVDYLTQESDYGFVVRFSGGPQAAHNVVTNDGLHHTFAQFGSGTFNAVPTILTRHMLVNPLNMEREAEALEEKIGRDPFTMLAISENCLLITPWHWAINQLEEIRRGEGRHGSCGQGIGVAQKFALDYPDLALRVGDMLLDRDSFVAKATIVRELLKAEYGWHTKEEFKKMNGYTRLDFQRSPGNVHGMFEIFMKDHNPLILSDEEINELIRDHNCVWEGSQGALLDEWKGFHPYTTWSTTTAQNALQLLSEAFVADEDIEVIGVSRTYHTRHGAGPFPTEETALLGRFPEPHNGTGKYQGAWRVGAFDTALFKYGVDANPRIDSLAFTHMDYDRIPVNNTGNFHLTTLTGDLEAQEKITHELLANYYSPNEMELSAKDVALLASQVTNKKLSILSYGPKAEDKLKVDSSLWTVVQ